MFFRSYRPESVMSTFSQDVLDRLVERSYMNSEGEGHIVEKQLLDQNVRGLFHVKQTYLPINNNK